MLLRRTPLLTDGRASDKALVALLTCLLERGRTQCWSQRVFKHYSLGFWHPWTLHPRSVEAELTGSTRPENARAWVGSMLLHRSPLLTDGRASDEALVALLTRLLELGTYSALESASIQRCDLGCWHPWTLHPRSVVAELTGFTRMREHESGACCCAALHC